MMHFVFRIGLKMHFIANTWGFFSDFPLYVADLSQHLLWRPKMYFFVLLFQFLEGTHTYSIICLFLKAYFQI